MHADQKKSPNLNRFILKTSQNPCTVLEFVDFFRSWMLKSGFLLQPLSQWSEIQFANGIAAAYQDYYFHTQTPLEFVFKRESKRQPAQYFHFNDTIISLKIIKNHSDAQIFLGKLWRWQSEISSNIVYIIIDPSQSFTYSDAAIPDPKQLLFLLPSDENKHVVKRNHPNDTRINDSGYYGYNLAHPESNYINKRLHALISTNKQLNSLKETAGRNRNLSIQLLLDILTNFPITQLLDDPKIAQPILLAEQRIKEIHLEWLLSEYLSIILPHLAINQYRVDSFIFDLYLPGLAIIELKLLHSLTDWDRCIGQIWDYSSIQMPIILYLYDPSGVRSKIKSGISMWPSIVKIVSPML
jgi:hypothetical protein